MSDLIGKTLGQYKIIEEIGRGGMATVYKAWDPTRQRYVALKVLPSYFQHDTRFLRRFRREAQAVARLRHPNIVRVFEAREVGGINYITMEYVDGGSLQDRLRQGQPLDLNTAASIVQQIGQALGYAHGRGIIHRDIKPSNILLARDGRALLSDFGIAKATEESRITQSGALIGTPEYMSPEQGLGQEVDYRSDIYSLGILLYEMLTGKAPFKADTPPAALHKQVYEPPVSPRRLNPKMPKGVEKVILKALSKRREERYQSVGELVAAFVSPIQQVRREAERRRQLATLYDQGKAAFNARKWQQAIELFEQIQALKPGYRETAALLARARAEVAKREEERRRQEKLAGLYKQGVEHFKAERWQEAVSAFEQTLAINPHYKDASGLLSKAKQAKLRAEEAAREPVTMLDWRPKTLAIARPALRRLGLPRAWLVAGIVGALFVFSLGVYALGGIMPKAWPSVTASATPLLAGISPSTPTATFRWTPASSLPPTATPTPVGAREEMTAQQIASEASEGVKEIESAHFGIEITGDAGFIYLGQHPTVIELALKRMEGAFLRPDRVQASLEVSLGALSAEIETVIIGQEQRITNPLTGQWESVAPDRGITPALLFDPEKGLGGILKDIEGLSRLDDEKVDGVLCYHLVGTVDSERIKSLMKGLSADGEIELETWVGIKDFYIRKMRMVGHAFEAGGRKEWTIVVGLSKFNEPVTIEFPTPAYTPTATSTATPPPTATATRTPRPTPTPTPTPDTAPPQIVSTSPAAGAADVPRDLQTFTITFSEPMQHGHSISSRGGFPLGEDSACTQVIHERGSATFTIKRGPRCNQLLPPDTEIVLIINPSDWPLHFRDLAGNPLPADQIITFKTAAQ